MSSQDSIIDLSSPDYLNSTPLLVTSIQDITFDNRSFVNQYEKVKLELDQEIIPVQYLTLKGISNFEDGLDQIKEVCDHCNDEIDGALGNLQANLDLIRETKMPFIDPDSMEVPKIALLGSEQLETLHLASKGNYPLMKRNSEHMQEKREMKKKILELEKELETATKVIYEKNKFIAFLQKEQERLSEMKFNPDIALKKELAITKKKLCDERKFSADKLEVALQIAEENQDKFDLQKKVFTGFLNCEGYDIGFTRDYINENIDLYLTLDKK